MLKRTKVYFYGDKMNSKVAKDNNISIEGLYLLTIDPLDDKVIRTELLTNSPSRKAKGLYDVDLRTLFRSPLEESIKPPKKQSRASKKSKVSKPKNESNEIKSSSNEEE